MVLGGMLYFLGAQHGFFPKFWGDKQVEKPATKQQMDKLSSYYNHDTTQILQSIDRNVTKVHKALESLEDSVKELKYSHSEMKEYGVKVRKE